LAMGDRIPGLHIPLGSDPKVVFFPLLIFKYPPFVLH
jgi:hypothetical protein